MPESPIWAPVTRGGPSGVRRAAEHGVTHEAHHCSVGLGREQVEHPGHVPGSGHGASSDHPPGGQRPAETGVLHRFPGIGERPEVASCGHIGESHGRRHGRGTGESMCRQESTDGLPVSRPGAGGFGDQHRHPGAFRRPPASGRRAHVRPGRGAFRSQGRCPGKRTGAHREGPGRHGAPSGMGHVCNGWRPSSGVKGLLAVLCG